MELIFITLGLILVIDLLIHLVSALIVIPIFERKIPFHVDVVPPNLDSEQIAFPTSHGLTLRGSLSRHSDRESRGLIVFCPELEGSHWSAFSYCEALWDAGFDILSFDFRNQGESDHMEKYSPLHWLTEYEVKDVLAAIAYAETRDDLKNLPLGLVGISRGGGAALATAAGCGDVKCVASEGAFSTESLLLHFTLRWASLYVPAWVLKPVPVWHLKISLTVARIMSQIRRSCRYVKLERLLPLLRNRPVLMIAGGRDTYVHPEVSEKLPPKIGGASVEFWLVPKAKHNMARLAEPELYDRRLVDFFMQMSTVSHSDRVGQHSV